MAASRFTAFTAWKTFQSLVERRAGRARHRGSYGVSGRGRLEMARRRGRKMERAAARTAQLAAKPQSPARLKRTPKACHVCVNTGRIPRGAVINWKATRKSSSPRTCMTARSGSTCFGAPKAQLKHFDGLVTAREICDWHPSIGRTDAPHFRRVDFLMDHFTRGKGRDTDLKVQYRAPAREYFQRNWETGSVAGGRGSCN